MSYNSPLALQIAQAIQPAFLNADGTAMRLDADPIASATLFLERQLTQVRNKVVNVEFSPLKALNYIPKATDIDASTVKYSWFSYNKTGLAEIIAPGRKSLPRVDVHGREHTGQVLPIGAAFGWDITDLRTAARLGTDLPTRKATAARTAIARAIENLLISGKNVATGEVSSPVGGFVNCPEIGAATVMHDWFVSTTTPEMMVSDLTALTFKPVIDTDELYSPNKMIMATKLYELASSTKMSSASDVTVLQYFLKNNPFIQSVDMWYALNGGRLKPLIDGGNAGAPVADSGTGVVSGDAKHRIIVYPMSSEILEAVVPIEYEQFAPQQMGLEFETACHARCGGVKIYNPLACQYGDVSAKTAA